MSGFTDKPTFDKHKCEESRTKKKKVDRRNEGKLLADLSHYLEMGVTMGSMGEIKAQCEQLKNAGPSVEK